MRDKNLYYKLSFIIALAFFAGIFAFGEFFNLSLFFKKPFKLGLDLQGGSHLVYEADLSQIEERGREETMAGLRDIIERRVNLFGVKEPIVQIQKERLIVELAGIRDVSEAIKMIGQTPYLEFKEQRSEEETQKILAKQKEIEGKTQEELQQIPDWQLAFEDPYFMPTPLTGKYLKKAEVEFKQTIPNPIVSLEFNDEGAKIFEELTSKNVGKPLAIYIDFQPISTPVVQEKISGGRAQISGNFTIEEAKNLARNLNAGALPVPIKLISQQSVGPSLGKISLDESLKAGIFGFLAILLFLIIFYRIPGLFASLSLLIYASIILSLFKLIPVTLTLAGIAGFLLSLGMAVDANILIFSRMREELKEGKSYLVSLEEGSRRAWPSIRDGNFTTILVGLILFYFGTGFVQGFALTLVIGNLIGMFTAIFITNNFLRCFAGEKSPKLLFLWR